MNIIPSPFFLPQILLKILAAKGRFIRVSDSTVFTIFLLALPWAFWGALTICGIIVRCRRFREF